MTRTIHLRPSEDVVAGILQSVELDGLVILTDRLRFRVHVAVPHPETFAGRENQRVEVRGPVRPLEAS